MADNAGAIDLGSLGATAEEETGEPQEGAPKRKVLTAFLVLVGEDFNPEIMAFGDPDLEIILPPTNDLVYGACATVLKDFSAQETAQATATATVQLMMAQTRAMAEQQQAAALRSKLGV